MHTLHMNADQAAQFDHDDIVGRIERAVGQQTDKFKESFEIIQGGWVALIARQHLLMVGEPGTAKSMLARDFSQRIADARYFEAMLTPTSEPTSIVGPKDFNAMRNGRHIHRVDGYLPTAHFAFLDEVLNASGALLDNTLAIFNERKFHQDGEAIDLPLWSVFMGTNQLSEQQRQAGWWDRIDQRHLVTDVADRDELGALIVEDIQRNRDGASNDEVATISLAELAAAHLQSLSLTIPDTTLQTLLDIRSHLNEEYNIRISARRMAKTMRAAMAQAYLNRHDEVEIGDLSIAAHMLWMTSDHAHLVERAVYEYVGEDGGEISELVDSLREVETDFNRLMDDQSKEESQKRADAMEHWTSITDLSSRATSLREQIERRGGDTTDLDNLTQQITDLNSRIMQDGLKFDPVDPS